MPTYFQKPENALKRAGEFIEVEKPEEALDVLYDVIKSKRHRTWQKTHEPIMLRYLELCVDLKKSHLAKEGLYQYKNICQQVNVKSLDTVIRRYLEIAEQKTEDARQESKQTVLDVEDLDVLQTPESLLLATVTGEDAQDRNDRAILTPWVKFLWESYRQCLDLLRNNNRVEKLYHDIAKQAFEFCLKYTRKTEFRKLCDNLRNHLKHVIEKTHTQANAVSLSNPETLSLHLETRLAQLDASIQMELWQEAFKAVEDIHDLIIRSKKVPRPSLLANYFEKFGLVFWKSSNHLFHAASCHRLFLLINEQKKNPSQDEINRMANRVLCATLAVPIPPTRYSIDQLLESNDAEKRRRLATLLSLPTPPTRTSLVKDLLKSNVLQHVSPEIRSLYQIMEVDFDPLALAAKVQRCLEFVNQQDELRQYIAPLQEITIVRLVKQVAQIYQTIEFDRLHKLVPFISTFELERVIVQAAKNIDLPVRLDHKARTVSFGTDLNSSLSDEQTDGPFLQHMPGDQLRNQLQYMAQAMCTALDKLQITDKTLDEKQELKLRIIDAFRKSEKRDREKVLKRKHVIEKRKEDLENLSQLKDSELLQQEENRLRLLKEAEEERLKREMAEREKQRAKQEHDKIKRKEAEKRIEQLKATEIGIRALEGLTEAELADLDTDEILQKQVEQLEKEKKELAERLKAQEKKIDHFIRAKRIEEIPLLEEHAKEVSQANREKWNLQEQERIEALKQERELAMQHRDRLRRMLPDKEHFLQQLKDARSGEYVAKLNAFQQTLEEARKVRLAERQAARKEERKQKAIRDREERLQRERDEAIRREREERIRREQEEAEAKQREQEERMAKLEEIAERQRQKEREIEQRLERERAQVPSQVPPLRSGGWRDREAAKQGSWLKRDEGARDDTDGRSKDEPQRVLHDDLSRSGRDEPNERWQRGGGWENKRDMPKETGRAISTDDRHDSDRWERRGDLDHRDSHDRKDVGRREMPSIHDADAKRDSDRWQRGVGALPSSRDDGQGRRPPTERRLEEDSWRGSAGGGWRRDDEGSRRGADRDDGFRHGAPRDSALDRDDNPRRAGQSDDSFRRITPRDGPSDRDEGFRRGPHSRDVLPERAPPRDSQPEGDSWRRGEPRRAPPPKVNEDKGEREGAGWSTVKYK